MGSVCRHVFINWLPFQTFPPKRCQCYVANLADFGPKKKNNINWTKSNHFPTSVIKRINRNSQLKTDKFRRSKEITYIMFMLLNYLHKSYTEIKLKLI